MFENETEAVVKKVSKEVNKLPKNYFAVSSIFGGEDCVCVCVKPSLCSAHTMSKYSHFNGNSNFIISCETSEKCI